MKRTAIAGTLLLAALALGGCSSTTGVEEFSLPSGGAPARDSADLSAESADGGQVTDQQVITTGWATVTVEEPTEAARTLAATVEKAGGHVQSRQEYAPVNGGAGNATLTLRIPAAALSATLESLSDLGEVREISTTEDDVTTQVVDLQARVTALQASVDRLLSLLATATDTSTLLEIETTLSERQGELESLQSQLRYLDDQVDLSTITVELVSPDDAPVDRPDTFLDGLETGWASFVGFLAGLLVLLGVLLPWIVFLAVIGGAVLLIVRRRIRRRARTAETAPTDS